jgi:CRP/FNR family cyclic AMP-dependent transcriptional regulator
MNEQVVEKLKRISLFEKIKDRPDAMGRLAAIGRPRRFGANATIFLEGDKGSEMYIVLRGAVQILKKTRAGDDYTVAKLAAEMNIFFGELALIDDDTRSATVKATEETECLVISKTDFVRLGDEHPEIALPVTQAIARIISSRTRKTTQDMLTIFDALVNEVG